MSESIKNGQSVKSEGGKGMARQSVKNMPNAKFMHKGTGAGTPKMTGHAQKSL